MTSYKRVPYRPSNATEGECFERDFCSRCERERRFRQSKGEADGCSIHVRVFALAIDDPDYPKEWREDGPDGPRCTAFRPEGSASDSKIKRDRERYEQAMAEMRAAKVSEN